MIITKLLPNSQNLFYSLWPTKFYCPLSETDKVQFESARHPSHYLYYENSNGVNILKLGENPSYDHSTFKVHQWHMDGSYWFDSATAPDNRIHFADTDGFQVVNNAGDPWDDAMSLFFFGKLPRSTNVY